MGKVISMRPYAIRRAGQAQPSVETPDDVATSRNAWRTLAIVLGGLALYEGVKLLGRRAARPSSPKRRSRPAWGW